ncbi:MAG: ABC transporter ATP-binding protein [Rhodospirillaceae bacterium]|nr:ABC transporter ATP-binding protein [Rhodospirillaceae bacterium]
MTDSSPILKVEGLEKTFGAVVAASNINIDVQPGEIIGIIGANGAGKTTFVNMVTGYLTPSAGSIQFEGREMIGLPPRKVTQAGISRSFQVSQVFSTMTVEENILTALAIASNTGLGALRQMMRPELVSKCNDVLERYQIAQHRDHTAGTLSQGVRKLLDIAMAVISKPRILLLDEPTSGISVEEKFDLMDIVMTPLREDNVTVLFIEHDMEIVERYVSRVIAFYQGEIICDESPTEALADPKVQEYVIGTSHPHAKKGA